MLYKVPRNLFHKTSSAFHRQFIQISRQTRQCCTCPAAPSLLLSSLSPPEHRHRSPISKRFKSSSASLDSEEMASRSRDKDVIIRPRGDHTATIIFTHGLGDTGHGWSDHLASCLPGYFKIVCPTAPVRPVTLNGGFRMNAWYDLKSLNPEAPEDEDGLNKGLLWIHDLIQEEEAAGIPSNRIVVGGFSMGGALALYAALRYPKPLAAIVGLSCWVPIFRRAEEYILPANRTTPMLQCHGTADFIVPCKWGELSSTLLKRCLSGGQYTFKTYPGLAHSSSDQEMKDLTDFVKRNVPAAPSTATRQ